MEIKADLTKSQPDPDRVQTALGAVYSFLATLGSRVRAEQAKTLQVDSERRFVAVREEGSGDE